MKSNLIDLLSQYDVISFDVFDTLLSRAYLAQEDLWADVSRSSESKSKRESWCSEFELENGGSEFLRARIAADRKTYDAATARGGEHTLDEAYRMMPGKFAALEAAEERLQRECLRVNADMLAVWKRAGELGKKRIIVSDMYLSEAWFADTLKAKGFGDYDALYVSSAHQARKSTGRLFDLVRRDFPDAKIMHIGDNAHSDVEMAKAHGFSAWKVEGPVERFLRDCPFVKEFLNDFRDPATRRTVAAMAVGWRKLKCEVEVEQRNVSSSDCESKSRVEVEERNFSTSKKDEPTTVQLQLSTSTKESPHHSSTSTPDFDSYWTRLGYIHAGLLGTIFVRWVVETAKKRGIDTLWFVARDGYVWQRICKILYPEMKTAYFYAPRSVLTCATSDIGTSPNVQKDRCALLAQKLESRVRVGERNVSSSDCELKSKVEGGKLKCEVEVEQRNVSSLRKDETTTVQLQLSTSTKIYEVLTGKVSDPALTAALKRLNERTLADYRAYLATVPGDLDRVAVVDGCSLEFSVQRLLKAATGRDIPAFYLASMAPMHNAASLFATEGNTLPFQYLTEFLFGSPERPIADVNAKGPVYGEASAEEAFKESVSESICRGAEACALELQPHTPTIRPALWANWIEEFMRGMTDEDREMLAKARNSTDIHHRVFEDITWKPQPKCRPINRPWLARLGVRVRWDLREGVSRMRLTLGRFTLWSREWRIFTVENLAVKKCRRCR